MVVSVGEILIFKGSNSRVEHYKNFEVGKAYEVYKITSVAYDDYVDPLYDTAVLFRDTMYGVYLCEISECFEPIESFRDRRLSSLDL